MRTKPFMADTVTTAGKHPLANRNERKYLKTGAKASSSGYQRKELCQNVATGAALHHTRKNPSKSNQETPMTGCGP